MLRQIIKLQMFSFLQGFKQISPNGNMFDNLGISNGFSYIALAIKFAVCIAARRKVLPFGLLQVVSLLHCLHNSFNFDHYDALLNRFFQAC